MQTFKLIIVLLLATFIGSLVVVNQWMLQQKFAISYLGYQTPEVPLILLFLILLTVGAMMAIVSMLAGQLRLKSTLREQKRKIVQVEEELNSLRNLPLRESGSQLNGSPETENTLTDY